MGDNAELKTSTGSDMAEPAQKEMPSQSITSEMGKIDSVHLSDNPLMNQVVEQKNQFDLKPSVKNKFYDFMKIIPGFSGYKEREKIRDDDKLQRVFIADALDKVDSELKDFAADAVKSGDTSFVVETDRISKKLDKLSDMIRHASYGYSGFFDANKINEPELKAMYDFDSSMMDFVTQMQELGKKIISEGKDKIKDNFIALDEAISKLSNAFSKRNELIKGGKKE